MMMMTMLMMEMNDARLLLQVQRAKGRRVPLAPPSHRRPSDPPSPSWPVGLDRRPVSDWLPPNLPVASARHPTQTTT